MLQKLKTKLLILTSVFMIMVPAVAVGSAMTFVSGGTALADCNSGTTTANNDCIQGGLCQGATTLSVQAGTQQCQENGTGLTGTIATVVNVLSVIVGVVAVIMIIIGGFRYITSGGKQESVTGAKNTILYAVIGLVIVALAQIIVRFVLTRTTSTT